MDLYPPQLLEKVKSAPKAPGCYLFMDKFENIIYVGKAKNLKNRVSSYFTKASRQDERLEDLLPQIVDVEFQTVASELNALILEYQLIKRYKPWFNSAMKPDKLRPYLCISHEEPYPTLSVAQETAEDDREYYDPIFTDEQEIRDYLTLLGDVWGIARCGLPSYAGVKSPCLYHSMGKCLTPCTGKADAEKYDKAVDEARQLIRPHRETRFSLFFVWDGAAIGRADFDDMPSLRQLEKCLEEWIAAVAGGEDERLLARCLTDISAYKAFVVLREGFDAKAL